MASDGNLQVLNALDDAKNQWCRFTAIVIAGMGFFTDAYDLFSYLCLPRCLAGLTNTSQSPKPRSLPLNVSAAVNGVALVGTKASTKTFYNFQFCFMCSGSLGSLNQVSYLLLSYSLGLFLH
ncbi:putative MFS transporter superfamily [Helianthus annuus]|nr:putative MFS transporter superfamily [Helianthus annuus]